MPSPRADITPAVLSWARNQARLSIEEAAKKIPVKPDRYAAWEDDKSDLKPTIKQLRKLSKVMHRPVSLFYLVDPPTGFQPMKDLRRQPGEGLLGFSPQLAYEIELAQQRREFSFELSTAIGADVRAFDLTASIDEDPESVAKRIREALGITFATQSKMRSRSRLEPFKYWRRAIESLDVLVFQMSRVEWQEVSGFALSSSRRPIIAVNRKDVPNRRTFSLLHEFTHLMLRQSGASDLDVDATMPPETQQVEVYCNAVAGAALIPRDRLLGIRGVQDQPALSEDWDDDQLHDIANQFGVSRIVLLRRLLKFRKTTTEFYSSKANQWNREFKAAEKRKKQLLKASKKQFRLNPPRDVYYNLGRPFVRLVLDSMHSNYISMSEASSHFGNLRVRHFPNLERDAYAG